jgi:hypothetical protein
MLDIASIRETRYRLKGDTRLGPPASKRPRSLSDGPVLCLLDAFDDPGPHSIQVNVRRHGGDRGFVKNRDTSKATFPEVTGTVILSVGTPGDGLLEFGHKPADA